MSAIDRIRSFAESRERDELVIRDGLTYGDARALSKEIAWFTSDIRHAVQRTHPHSPQSCSACERIEAALGGSQ